MTQADMVGIAIAVPLLSLTMGVIGALVWSGDEVQRAVAVRRTVSVARRLA